MSVTALAERASTATVTADQLDLVKRTVAQGATDAELKLFLFDCQRQGVHPLDKLLHFTKRGGKYTPITSIDFMRTRAADTGEYAGSDDAVFVGTPKGEGFAASVTVWRMVQGQRCPFTATARWSEYKPSENAFMWDRMGHTMLAKCAEGLALRKGFPRQLAGLYAKEELDQAGSGREPSGVAEPPADVVDVTTGATVPAAERPEPPTGYRYIDGYRVENGWHHVTFTHADVQGGAVTFKTKLDTVGTVAAQAFQMGLPVKVESKPGRSKDEAWLNKVIVYKPEPVTPLLREPGEDDGDHAF